MANVYQVGDAVRVKTVSGFADSTPTAFDPDVVRGKVKDPSGNVVTYVYGVDVELAKDGTGLYHFDVDVDEAGTWYYRLEGESSAGAHQGADEGTFEAEVSQF